MVRLAAYGKTAGGDNETDQILKILCVHGVGHGEADPNFEPSWQKSIIQSVKRWSPDSEIQIDFFHYDQYFDEDTQFRDSQLSVYFEAASKLLASGLIHGITDFFTGSRGLFELPEQLRWTIGLMAQWAAEDKLRKKTSELFLKQLQSKCYDLVCAHSLGSLICYDGLNQVNNDEFKDLVFLSFGSQIGNPFVRDVFGGRISPLKNIGFWYHLYNSGDIVLTAPIKLDASNFLQVPTTFDIPNDILNHDATWYLTAPNTSNAVWRNIAGASAQDWLVHSPDIYNKAKTRDLSKPNRRALLIGINEYPDPSNRLEGCVNDVFLMSSLLQEEGFKPEEIRVVLNDRATTAGILERLHWLVDETKPGDQRVLFYSGHGAQIPGYGSKEEIDHLNECLVPYDFDWNLDHAITDKQFCEFYSQLPYGAQFIAIFDCCHSGGLSRDGSRRARGINPPDDIRHRNLQWNAKLEMWEERKLISLNPELGKSDKGVSFLGINQATYRIGRAVGLRSNSITEYKKRRKLYGHEGPFLPVLLEACQEDQLSYEYRHGVTSYGAYTYSLVSVLRKFRKEKKRKPTFKELNKLVANQLKKLKYDQTPCLLGPVEVINQQIP